MPNFYLFRHWRVSKRSIRPSYRHDEIDLRHEKQVSAFCVIVFVVVLISVIVTVSKLSLWIFRKNSDHSFTMSQ